MPVMMILPFVPAQVVGLVTVPSAIVAVLAGSLNVCDKALEVHPARVTVMPAYAAALNVPIVYVPVAVEVIEIGP